MRRIVLVEDNEHHAFMLQTRFELQDDVEVLVAVNGNDGLAMVADQQPDLVLMDLNLPDIDGLEVTRRLKADPLTAAIPVIALTADAISGDREKALAAGCDEFDTKPVDFDRLMRIANAVLGPNRVFVGAANGRRMSLIGRTRLFEMLRFLSASA